MSTTTYFDNIAFGSYDYNNQPINYLPEMVRKIGLENFNKK